MKANDRVVVYGSLGLRRGVSDLLWAFRKANKLEEFPAYFDDHPYQLMQRIKIERKNGMRSADVVLMPHYAVTSMGTEGELAGYRPAPRENIPPNMQATKAGAVPVGVTFMAMAYNTKFLGRADLPSGVSDLAHPSWRGKLGTQSLTASKAGNLGAWYLAFLRKETGEKGWRTFIDSLGLNRPASYDCIDHLLQGLLDGDIRLALTVYSLAYMREKSSGSTLALVEDELVPHMMTFTTAALLKESRDSLPAKKFMDFLLTPEAQKIVGSIPGIAPVAQDVTPSYDFEHSYGGKTKFHPVGPEFREARSAIEVFRRFGLP